MDTVEFLKARKRKIKWLIFYGIILVGIVFGLYEIGNQFIIRTVPTGQVELTVSQQQYEVGQTVYFTLTNDFAVPIYVTNKCPQEPLNVYRLSDNTWVRIHDQATSNNCPAENREIEIPPHASITSNYANWPHLFNTPGTYLIEATVSGVNGQPYQVFKVVAQGSALGASTSKNSAAYLSDTAIPDVTPTPSPAVLPAPASVAGQTPTISSFTSNKSTVASGNTVNLSWATKNATGCTIAANAGSPGTVPTQSSSWTSLPLSSATTFTLSCIDGSSKPITATVKIQVT